MLTVPELWLPILVAAALVFIASSVIHMLLPYHRNDYGKVPREDDFVEAVRPLDIPAGDYVVPHAGGDMAVMRSEEFRARAEAGPVLFMTVLPRGNAFAMGGQLARWFAYLLVVSTFAAYLTGRALVGDAPEYLDVFRFAGTTAFAAYGLGHWAQTIWYRTKVSTAVKNTFDGLVYALLTAGAFGWLWPTL